jgi:hypothetical protein
VRRRLAIHSSPHFNFLHFCFPLLSPPTKINDARYKHCSVESEKENSKEETEREKERKTTMRRDGEGEEKK